ncbi:UNVERIFIED_CONTAM: hypothetical protein PYX00_011844 [Menopon gallinae]|uniref:phosphatidate cytidylyltransferase n=1 Tax=Menopon gallinae TaxID=328185 RepID=A0AAW2H8W7_9NEOP
MVTKQNLHTETEFERSRSARREEQGVSEQVERSRGARWSYKREYLREVVSAALIKRKMTRMSKYLTFHFFIAANIFFLHKSVISIFSRNILIRYNRFCTLMGFCFYVTGFCIFTYSLRKKSLKKQFYIFGVTHLTTILMCKAVKSAIQNLARGKFWVVFPAALVISNDISAYVVGKMLGRRPLLRISPKKTIEGFVGGFVGTVVLGVAIAHSTLRFRLTSDEYLGKLSEPIALSVAGCTCTVQAMYIHSLFFILFASFVAPFGGFFASGYKRMFGVKDFGTIIPGHGGMMDRMDCQFMMAVFTNVYVSTFLNVGSWSVADVALFVQKKLDRSQIEDLVHILSSI